MVKTITYSLINDADTSDYYYNDISCLTNNIFLKAESDLFPVINSYTLFLEYKILEVLRTKEEYVFDLLNAGTIMRIYHREAANLTYPEYFILSNLYKLRRKSKKLKPYIDWFRGIMGTYSLRKKDSDENEINFISLKTFTKVIRWMEATGEFREEVKRLKLFRKFLKSIPKERAIEYLRNIIQFSGWFEFEAGTVLKQYTFNIENYLREDYNEHLWKEDVIFCGRKEVEYHLSMVGAELMNRAFKENFKLTNKKAVLLPACMKLLPEGKCKAKKISLDYICTGCSPECKINKYTSIGKENGFEVHIIPHSSDFTKWLKHFAVGNDIGVVGVACPLNLTTGGLELKSLNVPAQCILIDYCGCKTHWDKEGIPTDINLDELIRTINGVEKEIVLD
jgi:uncharacterized protein